MEQKTTDSTGRTGERGGNREGDRERDRGGVNVQILFV